MRIVLASTSPRRLQLLQLMLPEIPLSLNPDADESRVPGEHPVEYALRVAELKLESAVGQVAHLEDCLVIAGDTIVALEERVFGKPENPAQAVEFLRALSGRTHHVISALAMARFKAGVKIDTGHCIERTAVTFKGLDDRLIDYYLNNVHVMDKAGAYAIQQHGNLLVESISGSLSGVVGFPIRSFLACCSERGWADHIWG